MYTFIQYIYTRLISIWTVVLAWYNYYLGRKPRKRVLRLSTGTAGDYTSQNALRFQHGSVHVALTPVAVERSGPAQTDPWVRVQEDEGAALGSASSPQRLCGSPGRRPHRGLQPGAGAQPGASGGGEDGLHQWGGGEGFAEGAGAGAEEETLRIRPLGRCESHPNNTLEF